MGFGNDAKMVSEVTCEENGSRKKGPKTRRKENEERKKYEQRRTRRKSQTKPCANVVEAANLQNKWWSKAEGT